MALIKKATPLSSSGLNFKVIGSTTQPNNPNLVWYTSRHTIEEISFN